MTAGTEVKQRLLLSESFNRFHHIVILVPLMVSDIELKCVYIYISVWSRQEVSFINAERLLTAKHTPNILYFISNVSSRKEEILQTFVNEI